MAAVFQSNVFQNNVFQVGGGSAGDIVFQCNVFQHNVFAVGAVCRAGSGGGIVFQCNVFQPYVFQVGDACRSGTIAPTRATTRGDPGGYDAESRRRAEEFAAFHAIEDRARERSRPRDIPDAVKSHPETVRPEATVDVPPVLAGPSPLPIIMDFGAGKVTLGIKAPSLAEALHNQILADDEEALAVILAAIQ